MVLSIINFFVYAENKISSMLSGDADTKFSYTTLVCFYFLTHRSSTYKSEEHDDVIKWKHFPR